MSYHNYNRNHRNNSRNNAKNKVYWNCKDKWQREQIELRKKVVLKTNVTFAMPRVSIKKQNGTIMKLVKQNKNVTHNQKNGIKYIGALNIAEIPKWHWNKHHATAGLTIHKYPSMQVVHEEIKILKLQQPYISGYLAFREIEPSIELINNVKNKYTKYIPDLIIVNGNGFWHYRRMGFASHLGAVTNIVC